MDMGYIQSEVSVSTQYLQPEVSVSTQYLQSEVSVSTQYLQSEVSVCTQYLQSEVSVCTQYLQSEVSLYTQYLQSEVSVSTQNLQSEMYLHSHCTLGPKPVAEIAYEEKETMNWDLNLDSFACMPVTLIIESSPKPHKFFSDSKNSTDLAFYHHSQPTAMPSVFLRNSEQA
ncbi:hypothetical protein STEG23_023203, partial [Scotinomys teguina]